jgi:hypothetical protein
MQIADGIKKAAPRVYYSYHNFWVCFGAARSFGAPLDGFACRSRGSDQLPGHTWNAHHHDEGRPVNRVKDIPASNPDGAVPDRRAVRIALNPRSHLSRVTQQPETTQSSHPNPTKPLDTALYPESGRAVPARAATGH